MIMAVLSYALVGVATFFALVKEKPFRFAGIALLIPCKYSPTGWTNINLLYFSGSMQIAALEGLTF